MGRRRGLIDTNLLVASSAADHIHYRESEAFIAEHADRELVVAQHSLSEFYNIATRAEPRGLALAPAAAMDAVTKFCTRFEIAGLDLHQHMRAMGAFASVEGKGPRVYDFLIGFVATANEIRKIVTWNKSHFAPLFPHLEILTPAEALA